MNLNQEKKKKKKKKTEKITEQVSSWKKSTLSHILAVSLLLTILCECFFFFVLF